MDYKFLILAVIICFSCIQLIEVWSFIARVSGVREGKRSLAYTLQNAIFMLTRFFTLALMPFLGLLIDYRIDKQYYLIMVFLSLLGGAILGYIAYFFRDYIVFTLSKVINKVSLNGNIFKEIVLIPFYLFSGERVKKRSNNKIYKGIFLGSSIVFSIYSLSVFMVFYIALFFPDYRTTISQLSGVTNAFATVLLTFFIEPKISRSIDNNVNILDAEDMIYSLILGRIFGISVISILIVLLIWLFEVVL